jgi:hypothetical protein
LEDGDEIKSGNEEVAGIKIEVLLLLLSLFVI